MKPPGPLLASGRDADIFEYGPGLVLRRARDGRSIAEEARTMTYLRERGYPVPAVEEISEDGAELVMERVDGPTMVDAVGRAPWTLRQQARSLADLHQRLHAIAPPDFLAPAPVGEGTSIVHLDLHPLNVLVSPTGPVVIDWTNARIGDPAVDVAIAWVLMAAGQIPGGGLKAKALGFGRQVIVNAFIAGFDRAEVARRLRDVVTWKVTDPHMSPEENATMWRLVEREEARRRA